jgi:hypothetical protein
MSIQSAQLNLLQTQQPINNPSINSGSNAGAVFNGRGHDFLDPNKVLNNVDGFTSSIGPITSNTLTGLIAPGDPTGDNPDSSRILNTTNRSINQILSPNFGTNITFPVELEPGPFVLPVPALGENPDPTKIVLNTLFFSNNIQPIQSAVDPRNFNPAVWQNPNATNILIGTLQGQSNVLTGNIQGLQPTNPFPTQTVVQFPFQPFQTIPNPSQTALPNGTLISPTGAIVSPNGTLVSNDASFGNNLSTMSVANSFGSTDIPISVIGNVSVNGTNSAVPIMAVAPITTGSGSTAVTAQPTLNGMPIVGAVPIVASPASNNGSSASSINVNLAAAQLQSMQQTILSEQDTLQSMTTAYQALMKRDTSGESEFARKKAAGQKAKAELDQQQLKVNTMRQQYDAYHQQLSQAVYGNNGANPSYGNYGTNTPGYPQTMPTANDGYTLPVSMIPNYAYPATSIPTIPGYVATPSIPGTYSYIPTIPSGMTGYSSLPATSTSYNIATAGYPNIQSLMSNLSGQSSSPYYSTGQLLSSALIPSATQTADNSLNTLYSAYTNGSTGDSSIPMSGNYALPANYYGQSTSQSSPLDSQAISLMGQIVGQMSGLLSALFNRLSTASSASANLPDISAAG